MRSPHVTQTAAWPQVTSGLKRQQRALRVIQHFGGLVYLSWNRCLTASGTGGKVSKRSKEECTWLNKKQKALIFGLRCVTFLKRQSYRNGFKAYNREQLYPPHPKSRNCLVTVLTRNSCTWHLKKMISCGQTMAVLHVVSCPLHF